MILLFAIGAVFAGLFLGLKDLLPLLAARRSGVVLRKGAREVRVRRDEDPAGFERLLANRSKGAATGFGLSMLGLIGLGLFGLAIAGFSGPLALVILAISVGFSLFALYCLIRGFTTGRMFAFWGFTLFGEAARRANPIWFWIYAALNALSVLGGVSTLLRVL
jgi:hypothetical protein